MVKDVAMASEAVSPGHRSVMSPSAPAGIPYRRSGVGRASPRSSPTRPVDPGASGGGLRLRSEVAPVEMQSTVGRVALGLPLFWSFGGSPVGHIVGQPRDGHPWDAGIDTPSRKGPLLGGSVYLLGLRTSERGRRGVPEEGIEPSRPIGSRDFKKR